tara:strand:+ start:87 stop:623 length:537 start_codon:yes stop_codon:yes gene_type:complete
VLFEAMFIEKFFNKKIEQEYFFIKGKIDLDSNYLIETIKGCWGTEHQFKPITNVKGLMTDWKFFNKEEKFLDPLRKIVYYINSEVKLEPFNLVHSWGIELRKNSFTSFHKHSGHPCSGVIYLNSSKQNLIFPEIRQEVKPEPGVFVVFSGFLTHGCAPNEEDSSKFAIAFNMGEVQSW